MTARARAQAFCDTYGLRVPILQAPMAGACPPRSPPRWPAPAAWAASAR